MKYSIDYDQREYKWQDKQIRDLNRLASEREEAEAASAVPRRRFTCGLYFYSEPTPSPEPWPTSPSSRPME